MKLLMKTSFVAFLVVALFVIATGIWEAGFVVPKVRVGPLVTNMPETQNLLFFAIGDTGSGDDNQKAVASAMEDRCEKAKPDALLLLGDLDYMSGFSSLKDKDWNKKVFGMYGGPCMKTVPIYPVLGNHDYRRAPEVLIQKTEQSDRWYFPNRFYSLVFGELLEIVAYDTNVFDFCMQKKFCSVDFMLDRLSEGTTKWKMVMGHHPLSSSSDKGHTHAGGWRGLVMMPILCDKADIYLSGHAHIMEHQALDDCRMDLFVSGAGGGSLESFAQPDENSKFAKSQFGFLELEFNYVEKAARFIASSGEVLYETN